MNIAALTIFPRMFDAVAECGISAQAMNKGALALRLWNPRDFTEDRHHAVDDRPYGGGAGMVMKPEPLARAIDAAAAENAGPVIYLSPQGERLDQSLLVELAALPEMILLAGRYEGIDERIVQSRVAREISIGDYVLAGGELAAMVLIEGVARLLPGVLGNACSAQEDSFSAAKPGLPPLLDCPHYTRPEVFEGCAVPEVLLSGDHRAIRKWRLLQAIDRTRQRRPDMLEAQWPHGEAGESGEAGVEYEQTDLLRAYQREQSDE